MKKANTYSSDLIDELLNEITPRERKRTENRMRLAAKIADGLKAKGWSKQQLAKELGYNSPSIVTKWLSGTNNFTADVLSDIEGVLPVKLLHTEEKAETKQRDVFETQALIVVNLNPFSQNAPTFGSRPLNAGRLFPPLPMKKPLSEQILN